MRISMPTKLIRGTADTKIMSLLQWIVLLEAVAPELIFRPKQSEEQISNNSLTRLDGESKTKQNKAAKSWRMHRVPKRCRLMWSVLFIMLFPMDTGWMDG